MKQEERKDRDLRQTKPTTRRDAEEKLDPDDEKRIAELRAHYGWDKPVPAGALSRAHREPEVSRIRKRIGLGPAPRNAHERILGRTEK